ncbi:MAG: DUF4213 domain-containing protein [Clostridiales Family XIII bacterium]|jgi:uncharacterized protein (DUF4213/DUF364 family)|nr:DUF4213 domain-containing protein [Clostridiales Family XIII bacterium]
MTRKLYDDLYIGIPSGIRITGCAVGKYWTTVRIDGNIGLARTLEMPVDAAEFAARFVGKFLRDVAGHLTWENAARASVGVAAMNAWYNTADRIEGLEGTRIPERPSGGTAYVGNQDTNEFPLPMSPDFDAEKYKGLANYDNAVIASEALITGALPKLLELAGSANVLLTGYSLPATALFFSFGMPVTELRGFYPRFIDTVEACARKDIPDPAAGMTPFCVRPMKLKKIHESEQVRVALESPYRAAEFNNLFK